MEFRTAGAPYLEMPPPENWDGVTWQHLCRDEEQTQRVQQNSLSLYQPLLVRRFGTAATELDDSSVGDSAVASFLHSPGISVLD